MPQHPTTTTKEDEAFYVELEKFYKDTFHKVIIGDFNANIGRRRSPEELHIRTHGFEWNEQRERLYEFTYVVQGHLMELTVPEEFLLTLDLTGRTILITGTTSGIGVETARALALKGAHVVMANRNPVRAEALKKQILDEKPDAEVDLITCELSSLQSVQAAANEFKGKKWYSYLLRMSARIQPS
ncbi:unnamed protein product [Heligmosomoides polygyrus]|uniref:Retinol dehydrogenase 12 n=1 Tax=Heligmosomoides polygyrus TaxID=6339 RepID=A0A183FDE4_HELPZ|nr:unnamed protein product [Heligmosomoides polygyrus]